MTEWLLLTQLGGRRLKQNRPGSDVSPECVPALIMIFFVFSTLFSKHNHKFADKILKQNLNLVPSYVNVLREIYRESCNSLYTARSSRPESRVTQRNCSAAEISIVSAKLKVKSLRFPCRNFCVLFVKFSQKWSE